MTRLNLDNDQVAAAYKLASNAHHGQIRKYLGGPYFAHCVAVAEMVQEAKGCEPDMVSAALCHDVLEDTNVTEMAMRRAIGGRATSLVKQVTKDKFRGDTMRRADKAARTLHKLKLATPPAQTIKVCDIFSNIRGLVDLDPEFASIYLPEKREQLYWLDKADNDLRERAHEALKNEEAALRLIEQRDTFAAAVERNVVETVAVNEEMEALPGWGIFG
jgi:(p)ppGpp synthase/HD superfamily hydrolase